jgi:hypothetical protein
MQKAWGLDVHQGLLLGFIRYWGMSAFAQYVMPPNSLAFNPVPRRPVSAVFLPKEHGSWSLALEPLLLGLLVAPSWAGGAMAGAVLAGFFARRPLKAALEPVASEKRKQARQALMLLGALGVLGLVEAGILAGGVALWPLLLAAPFCGLFAWFDRRNQARVTAAELAGCAAFSFVPMMIATLAGWSLGVSLALAALAAARSIPAILTVRSYLRTTKGEAAGAGIAVAASVAAFAGVFALTARQLAPMIAVGFVGVLFLRTLWLTGSRRPAWPARRIGMMEAFVGLLYVVLVAVTFPSLLAR